MRILEGMCREWGEVFLLAGILSAFGGGAYFIDRFMDRMQKDMDKLQIKEACERVGYCCPEKVERFDDSDINRDGIKDMVLHLKDGSRITYNAYYSI